MNRTWVNFVIDTVAFVAFVLLTTTGVLMRYLLPPGSGHYTTIWGLDRHEWGVSISGYPSSWSPCSRHTLCSTGGGSFLSSPVDREGRVQAFGRGLVSSDSWR